MAGNKTTETDASAAACLAAIADPARRADCEALAALMARASGEPARMWGTAIVGFGTHRYRYESGREGEICAVGFASRKGDIAVYGLHGAPGFDEAIGSLGRHKLGKGCVSLRSLADVDGAVLERLVGEAARARMA